MEQVLTGRMPFLSPNQQHQELWVTQTQRTNINQEKSPIGPCPVLIHQVTHNIPSFQFFDTSTHHASKHTSK